MRQEKSYEIPTIKHRAWSKRRSERFSKSNNEEDDGEGIVRVFRDISPADVTNFKSAIDGAVAKLVVDFNELRAARLSKRYARVVDATLLGQLYSICYISS